MRFVQNSKNEHITFCALTPRYDSTHIHENKLHLRLTLMFLSAILPVEVPGPISGLGAYHRIDAMRIH